MLAATATIWILFSVWLLSPHVGVSRVGAQVVGWALVSEVALLLTWSYGTEVCDDPMCAPVARAAGVAATVDLPVLTVVIVAAALRTTTARRSAGRRTLPGSGER